MLISKVGIIKKGIEDLNFDYPNIDNEQPRRQSDVFSDISHDMFTYESVERREYDINQSDPHLSVKKIQTFNLKKDNILE